MSDALLREDRTRTRCPARTWAALAIAAALVALAGPAAAAGAAGAGGTGGTLQTTGTTGSGGAPGGQGGEGGDDRAILDPGSGCNCRAGGDVDGAGPRSAPLALLGLAAAAAARRRRAGCAR